MEIVVHNPNNLKLVDYRSLIPIQGDLKDLKDKNYKKLKNSLKKYGFRIPFFVWIPKENEWVIVDGEDFEVEAGKMYVLDGHQRIRVLTQEEVKPYELPYLLIEAENFLEAKKMILVVSSQYGKMTQEGLDAFAFDIETDFLVDFANFDAIGDFKVDLEVEEDDEDTGLETFFKVEVTCVDERDQEKIFNELSNKGYQCKLLTL